MFYRLPFNFSPFPFTLLPTTNYLFPDQKKIVIQLGCQKMLMLYTNRLSGIIISSGDRLKDKDTHTDWL